YADYLTRELIPFVDRELDTGGERNHRGCFGKSSGGYGALIHGMRYSRWWGAVASHSGDAYFEFCYGSIWPETLTVLSRYRLPPRRADAARARRDDAARARRDDAARARRDDAARARRDDAAGKPRSRPGLAAGLDDGRVRRFLDSVWQRD